MMAISQTVHVLRSGEIVGITLPGEDEEILPGLPWGPAVALFTPAYWALQARLVGSEFAPRCFRTGATLLEETIFCLLGGHGITYEMNVVAFEHLRSNRVFDDKAGDRDRIARLLSEPLLLDGRRTKYRFPNRRADFVAAALVAFRRSPPPEHDDLALRGWLLRLPGVGLKTASWIVRNWLDSDLVAILDIHVYRAGLLAGFFDAENRIERDYLVMEQRFLSFARATGVRASLLDGLIWAQMREIPTTVRSSLELLSPPVRTERYSRAEHIQLDAA